MTLSLAPLPEILGFALDQIASFADVFARDDTNVSAKKAIDQILAGNYNQDETKSGGVGCIRFSDFLTFGRYPSCSSLN